jgi:hypothetical protein
VTPGAYNGNWQVGMFITRFDMLPKGVTKFGASTPGCAGPLAAGVTSMAYPGNPDFGVTCLDAPPNAVGFIALSAQGLPAPATVSGAKLWVDPAGLVPLLPVLSNGLGFARVSAAIPGTIPIGAGAYLQFLWLDPCAPGGVSASNALEIVVQSP